MTAVLKDVLASEDLGTNVTSGECRGLQDSITAVDVRNAMFDWPYGENGHNHAPTSMSACFNFKVDKVESFLKQEYQLLQRNSASATNVFSRLAN